MTINPGSKPTNISEVPWKRRSYNVQTLWLLGVLFFPLLIWISTICLTGPVYRQVRDDSGFLEEWDSDDKTRVYLTTIFIVGCIIVGIVYNVLVGLGIVTRK